MSKAVTLTDKTFDTEVLKAANPVLVDFWAEWCGPCRMMAPVLDDVAGELAGKLVVAKLNIEDPAHQELAMKYDVRSIPNMKVFKDGKVLGEIIGYRPKADLLKDLKELGVA